MQLQNVLIIADANISAVTELLNYFRNHISILYKVSEALAMLDMLLSFAQSCGISDYGKHSVYRAINTKHENVTSLS